MTITRAQIDALTPEDYERGRKAVEDVLIEWRDERLSMPHRNNGLVCKERDGTPSDVIRLPIEWALKIGLEAIADQQ
jgi:hypothetical protein